jgi:hypothetical protein
MVQLLGTLPLKLCGWEKRFHSKVWMSALDYEVEPSVDCPNTNVNDADFVRATIGGRDAIEEFLACGMYPLSVAISFENMSDGTTTMSKVVVPLPIFPMGPVSATTANRFLAKVETNAEQFLGSHGPKNLMCVWL